MFQIFARKRRVTTNIPALPVAVMAVEDKPLPRVILDNDTPYVPFTEALTEENIEAAISSLLIEIAQPDYNACAAIAAIQTPQSRVDLIMNAMNYMMDGFADGYEDDEDGEEEDATFQAVKALIVKRKNIEITPQEYLDANRFSFSV